MSAAKFREITAADVPALFHVRTRTRENALTLGELQRLGIDPQSVTESLMASTKGWLCDVSGQVVAFSMADRATAEFLVIAVLPEYEGKGIGGKLMALTREWLAASGCTRAWLTTDLDTTLRAYGFYRKQGWTDWKIERGLRWMELSLRATIERAGHSDIPALVELMGQFYAESSYALDRDWATASFAQLLRDEARGAVWIARCGGEPAGHVVLALRHSMEFGGLAGVIDDLFVRPQFRRQGVGTALLSELFDACRKLHVAAVDVEVGPGNVAASALYRAFGLQGHGTQRRTMTVKLGTKEHAV